MGASASFLTFDDFDRFREVLRGWDVEPTQLSAGPLAVNWDHIVFDDMTIARLRANRVIADRMSYQPERVGFVVCLASKIFCGIPVEPGTLVLFGPGREYRSVLHEGWESFEISMSSPLLASLGLATDVTRRIRSGTEHSVLPLSESLVTAFREWAATFLMPFRRPGELQNAALWSGAVREGTLALLLRALRHDIVRDIPTVGRTYGWGLTARALEYIENRERQADDFEGQAVTVGEIAQAMGCTTRTLQSTFRVTAGVSPLQYVLARRLHHARRDLLSLANGPTSVTRVAVEQGFEHFGRFSHYYHRLFGELPSATVQRTRAARSLA